MSEQRFGENGEDPQILNEDDFEVSPATGIAINPKECLFNSYNMLKSLGDSMVEGVVVILDDGKISNAVRHCWNRSKSTGKYYDITKDKIWNTEEYIKKLCQKGVTGVVTYRYYKGYEYDTPKMENGYLVFRYNFNTLIDMMKG